MAQKYILVLDRERLRDTADMLRYDSAFKVDFADREVKIHCLRFTQDRWRTFATVPTIVYEVPITAKQERELLQEAKGFTEGLRVAQQLLGERLVEG